MICPVVVANEMSGLKGRVGVGSDPHWRLTVDAVISGPSFGTGNEDQGSHHTSDEWTVHMGPGCRDHRNHGSEHAAVAKTIEHGRLRGAAGSEDPSTECETDRHHGRGESLAALSGEIFRFECEALRGEAARRGTDFPELYVGEDGTAECRPCPAIPEAGTAPQKASTSATDGDDAACGWQ